MSSAMHILVLGASGRTGQLVVSEALRRGHQVTVLVRKAKSFEPAANLNVIVGTAEHKEDIVHCFQGNYGKPTAVITTLAAPRASNSPFAKPLVPPFFMRDCMKNLTDVMREQEVTKLVVLSAFGVGNTFQQLYLPLRILFRYTNMAVQFEDHDAVDAHVRETGLRWTLVRPCMLKDETSKPLRILDEKTSELGMFASCTRANVAEFLVNAAEVQEFEKKAVVIAN
ncbi:hypothetical protein LTR10_014262 [Elasticomyces elasticus]|uniref:NAD(P)-binding domain-containing protein n=1 Tax=Exophiala sideris TaxID=1016849 RepID=A0ABR0JI75_9EURO|nr:hypothetical protein LTR10_014262 [Elasticomyces elasticus]KAK5065681.1 hypothetical protein LTR69_003230 [Exophiala sideris]